MGCAAVDRSVLCIGIGVLDITGMPVPEPGEWKEKQRIGSISLQVGGDGANQCMHLASLGVKTYFCGVLGRDTGGDTVRSSLESRGVDISLSRIRDGAATGTALLLINAKGERRIFSAAGVHSMMTKEDLPQDIPEDCGAVTIGSLFGMPLLEEDGLYEFLEKVRNRGIPVFADLDSGHVKAGTKRIERLFPMIDYLLPSDYDLRNLTGIESREEAAGWLRERGAGQIVVKCGADGCEIFRDGVMEKIPAPHVTPVDTTGAGDCMCAALISRILAGDSLTQACRYGCAAGSLNTLYPGASSHILSDLDVRALLAKSSQQIRFS